MHEVRVHVLAHNEMGAPRLYYMACLCGYCGKPRPTQEQARVDGKAHTTAPPKRRRRGAGVARG